MRRIDRHIANFRADWQRNRALEIVRHSEIVVVEDLSVQNMTKSASGDMENPGRNVRAKAPLNREILARGWRAMRNRLQTKVEEFGGQLIEVDPSYTSQTCPDCEHVAKENRPTQARFKCVACGYTEHADVVGAINIMRRGISAGAQPVAGRGGHAIGPAPKGAAAERAETAGNRKETSNKSSCEPEASLVAVKGSRGAKPRNAHNDLGDQEMTEPHNNSPPERPRKGGSRDHA